MVSKAREDLPDPERPVITVKRSRGMSTLMFFRLCWRAPLTLMRSMAIAKTSHSSGLIFGEQAWTDYGAVLCSKVLSASSVSLSVLCVIWHLNTEDAEIR